MNETTFNPLPKVCAWRLSGAYEGHEVTHFTHSESGIVANGSSVGVENGTPWAVRYQIHIAPNWRVQNATFTDNAGKILTMQTDKSGKWTIDGHVRQELMGCLDLDLSTSAMTNTIPIHRLALSVGQGRESSAVYVQGHDLTISRLEQGYKRLPDQDGSLLFEYQAPRFSYHDTLRFGADGLVVDYPAIGTQITLQA